MQEWLFALFLFAGYYKADPRFAFAQTHVDITILFAGLSFAFFIFKASKKVLARTFVLNVPSNFIRVAFLFLLLTACVVGGLVYTQSREYGFDKAARFVLLTGWAFWGAAVLVTDLPSLKRFSWAIVALSTAMAIDALLNQSRSAFGSNYIALARACGLGLLTVLTFLLPMRRKSLIYLWPIAVLQMGAILSTGARGPVFAFVLSLALFFLMNVRGFPPFKIDRFMLRLGFVVLATVFLISIVAPTLFGALVFRTQVLVTELGDSAVTRLGFYRAAFDQWASSPIWGGGTGQFGISVSGMDIRLYPHNIVLELAAENGLVAVLAFLVMVGLAFGKALGRLRFDEGIARVASKYLLVASLFALSNALVTGDLNDNKMLFAMVALLSTSVCFRNKTIVDHRISRDLADSHVTRGVQDECRT